MSREMFQNVQKAMAIIGIVAASITPLSPQVTGGLKNIASSDNIPVSDTIDGMNFENTDSNDVSLKESYNTETPDEMDESIDINDILNDLNDSNDIADVTGEIAGQISGVYEEAEKKKKEMPTPEENTFKF